MTDDLAALVQGLRDRAAAVTSFVAEFASSYSINQVPFDVKGRVWYQRPDRLRSELVVRGTTIVTIRNGAVVERNTEGRPAVWRYDLAVLPQTEPMNFSLADPADPFFAVEIESLASADAAGSDTLRFTGRGFAGARGGVMDTRKGFSITYTPRVPEILVVLGIDRVTGLLVSMSGAGRNGREIFRLDRRLAALNAPLEDALFEIGRRGPGMRTIDVADVLAASLDPDAADGPPSAN